MLYDLFAHYLEKDTNLGLNELLNFLPYILVGPFAQHFSAGTSIDDYFFIYLYSKFAISLIWYKYIWSLLSFKNQPKMDHSSDNKSDYM